MRWEFEGVWVTPKQFARMFGLSEQGLANARSRERKTGRRPPDAPVWRRFGRSVRYWVPAELLAPNQPVPGTDPRPIPP
jgi:hypothetical protein